MVQRLQIGGTGEASTACV